MPNNSMFDAFSRRTARAAGCFFVSCAGHSGLGYQRPRFPLQRHLAIGDQYCDNHRDFSDGFFSFKTVRTATVKHCN